MRPGIVLTLYGGWMLASAVGFYAFPNLHLVLWSLLAVSSAGAIAAGILMHRPAHRAPWWLLVVAVTLFAAGDTTYNVLTTVLGEDNPFPSLADVFYLAMYPVMAAGLQLLVWYRTGGRDRGSMLDALSLTVALGLLSWIFLIEPHVRSPELTWLERATSIAYPLGDVLLLAVLARLLISSGRDRAAGLLGAGTAALLVSDVLYGFVQLQGSWQIGSWYDIGWVIFYITWGAAALHPSMPQLTVPAHRLSAEMSRRRIALLTAVSLIAPGALLADSLTEGVRNGPMIAICSAVLALLVLSRTSGVVARHSQAVERERTLRSAGASLVAATDTADVARSVCSTVDRLVPAESPHRAILLIHTEATAHTAATAGPTSPETSRIVPVAELKGAAADAARDFETALVCPLVRDDRPATGAPMGTLVVASTEAVLMTLRGAIEVLASQAALAVERVALAQEMSRRDNEAYFRTLVHNAHDVILIIDDARRVRYASPSAAAVLGPGSIVGAPVLDLVAPEDRDSADRALAAAARSADADSRTRDYRVVRTDGRRIDVEVAYRDLRTDPTVRGIVLTLRDITDQRRLQEELTERAFHDSLTGLANRVLLQERVEQALARRNSGLVGILLVDLDDFKLVNDTLGHATGDDLLIAVAGRLSALLRPQDLAARLGGDEFAVLVEGAPRTDEIEAIAARIVEALATPVDVAGGLTTSASVGVATTVQAPGPVDLLRQADLALYAAKAAGKGRWRRYQPSLHLAAVDRLAVRTELRQAIEDDELQMRYQPIVDLAGRGTVGVEALVRWHSSRRGTVLPSEFIPIAEETGLIVPLGAWVLDHALADLARWRRRGAATSAHVNVNVSAHQVRATRFVAEVADALTRWDLPPSSLVLEITETALLTDDAQVSSNLSALREHGVQIAIDDFGTGFASLDYVRLHAVDSLKIDRSFVHGIETARRQTALVGTIVHLAKALDLPVVAEGVETCGQRDALLLAGCRLGQGHLFLPPVPADDAFGWLGPAPDLGEIAVFDGLGAEAPQRALSSPPGGTRS